MGLTAFASDSPARVSEFHLLPHNSWAPFQVPLLTDHKKYNPKCQSRAKSYLRKYKACIGHVDLLAVAGEPDMC